VARDDEKQIAAGFQFLHLAIVQGRNRLDSADTALEALVELLADRGLLDRSELQSKIGEVSSRRPPRREVLPVIGTVENKYELDASKVACAELIAVCRAACCRMPVHLSKQDLDEGALKWDYGAPYRLRMRDDGYCSYCDPDLRHCAVYDTRPGPCRVYDCRSDARIWKDFARRIPSDAVAAMADED